MRLTALGRTLENRRPKLAAAAQRVYDAWDPDADEDGDPEVGGGGICDQVARAMEEVLTDIETTEGGQDGDDHAYLIAFDHESAYVVDIPPWVYERGAGYSWKKIRGVTIQPSDVVIAAMPREYVEAR